GHGRALRAVRPDGEGVAPPGGRARADHGPGCRAWPGRGQAVGYGRGPGAGPGVPEQAPEIAWSARRRGGRAMWRKTFMPLTNKVAVGPGGGSGIGRATALALARAGAAVVIGNRTARLGEEAVRAIRQQGGRAVFQATDVTQPRQVQALVRRAVEEFGRL